MARHENEGIQQTGGSMSVGAQAVGQNATAGNATESTQERSTGEPTTDTPTSDDLRRRIFVIHGRDTQARRCMFELLRALDLQPLEWELLVAATGHTLPFLGDVPAVALTQAHAALALFTPDDVVHLHPGLRERDEPDYETRGIGQPRPNVLLELGMALTTFPARTLIVEIGQLRPIADLAGRNVIRFDGSAIAIGKIVERLKLAGCAVDDRGADWRDTRRFAYLDAYDRTSSRSD
jgi:predicted nucleotide-binding protein